MKTKDILIIGSIALATYWLLKKSKNTTVQVPTEDPGPIGNDTIIIKTIPNKPKGSPIILNKIPFRLPRTL